MYDNFDSTAGLIIVLKNYICVSQLCSSRIVVKKWVKLATENTHVNAIDIHVSGGTNIQIFKHSSSPWGIPDTRRPFPPTNS